METANATKADKRAPWPADLSISGGSRRLVTTLLKCVQAKAGGNLLIGSQPLVKRHRSGHQREVQWRRTRGRRQLEGGDGGTAWCGASGWYICLAIERTRKDKDRKSLNYDFLMSPCTFTLKMMSHLPAHMHWGPCRSTRIFLLPTGV